MERKRLNSAEQKDFINLCAAESLVKAEALSRRIDAIPDGRKKLNELYGLIMEIVTGVMDQMPIEQLESYQKQMKNIAIAVGVKRADSYDDWDGRYLKFSEINYLLDGCGDHCLMCDKSAATMKRCGIRKVYNTLPAETVCNGLECDG